MATEELKVVTDKVRFAFVNIFEARSRDGKDDPSYSMCVMIPKNASGKKTLERLKKAQQAALAAKWGNKPPAKWKNTIHDGDEEMDLESYPEFEGHYYINVSAKKAYRPGVVGPDLQPIIDSTEVYSGCWGRVSMVAYGYDYEGTKGVSFGLRNVQKLSDDEPFGSVSSPENDFEAVDDLLS